MQISGKIKVINPEVQVSANFKKRELVVTTEEQFPQHIIIEFHQDKCDLLQSYRIGEEVKVSINLRGREWVNPQGESKYFNSIQGWRIERVGNENQAAPEANYPEQKTNPTEFEPAVTYNEEEHDDLPF